MNSSQFMDKQILGLSGLQSSGGSGGGGGGGGDLFDLMNPQEEHQINGGAGGVGGGGTKKEGIVPSYDFQPIRTSFASSPPSSSVGLDVSRPTWGSVDSKIATSNLKVRISLVISRFSFDNWWIDVMVLLLILDVIEIYGEFPLCGQYFSILLL